MPHIANNLERVRERLSAAAERAGRDASRITLLAVTKTVPVSRIEQALAAGVRALGESRVQEAADKIPLVNAPAEWHFIGPLQSNKARLAGLMFDAIHSVDRDGLLPRLAAAAQRRERPLDVYVQVDPDVASRDAEAVGAVQSLCDAVGRVAGLRLCGLMTIAPYDPDPESARPVFRRTRELRDRLQQDRPDLGPLGLSMGMSGDYEVAIEEGSTVVRIGTAIFGARENLADS